MVKNSAVPTEDFVMFMRWLTSLVCMIGLTGLVPCASGAEREQPPPQPGVDVLTRGPVHEAFAQVVDVNPAPTPAVPKQPPDPIEELPPDQRPAGENVHWIP